MTGYTEKAKVLDTVSMASLVEILVKRPDYHVQKIIDVPGGMVAVSVISKDIADLGVVHESDPAIVTAMGRTAEDALSNAIERADKIEATITEAAGA